MSCRIKQNFHEPGFGKIEQTGLPAPPPARAPRPRQPRMGVRRLGGATVQRHHAGQMEWPPMTMSAPAAAQRGSAAACPHRRSGIVLRARRGHGLVHHHHAQPCGPGACQVPGHAVDLKPGYLAMLVAPAPRGVDAHHHQVGRGVHGFEIVVAGEGRTKPHRMFRFVRWRCSRNPAFSEPPRARHSGWLSTDGDPRCKCSSSPAIHKPPNCAT